MSEAVAVEGLEGFAATALAAVGGARREVLLLSLELDPRLYGSAELVEAVQRFALSSERAELRLLLNRTELARRGHPLIALARRLPSRIQIRQLSPERRRDRLDELLIVDGRHLLQRKDARELLSRWQTEAPAVAKREREDYIQLWEESEPAADLRELSI
ncbi:hypothetical protein ED208_08700 [Stagnimonas aquatica]|uniref:DUF7931 domain-containing protein n=1 Tax=Stagnimonas aquatica TaxID=2689987 RepID=A0A3N0VE32_9GAMM|nr:hypothetical protein [Stagnimonas aquatica]ROH91037.1 hypothetical protein ED208_08700 [Stagnimonas aquatica]